MIFSITRGSLGPSAQNDPAQDFSGFPALSIAVNFHHSLASCPFYPCVAIAGAMLWTRRDGT
jgi:hypothetical protein